MLRRSEQAGAAGRQQGRQPARASPRRRRCGRWGWASRTRCRALHGRGSGDLLDAILAALPDGAAAIVERRRRGPRRVALVGRPNVGKSSLLNRLASEDRVGRRLGRRHDRRPGRLAGRASVARSGSSSTPPGCASGSARRAARSTTPRLRTAAAIEAAEVAVVLLDASEPISEQDQRVLSMVVEAGPGAGASPSTSGTWSTTTAGTTWTRRSTASCSGSRGRPGSTSPR